MDEDKFAPAPKLLPSLLAFINAIGFALECHYFPKVGEIGRGQIAPFQREFLTPVSSMNKTFRIIWSEARNTWVAASEVTGGRGKRSAVCASVAVATVTAALLGTASLAWADLSNNAGTLCMAKNGPTPTWTCQVPNGQGGFAVITGLPDDGSGSSPNWPVVASTATANLGTGALLFGNTATVATGVGSIAVGNGAKVPVGNSIAIGQNAQSRDVQEVIIGARAGYNAALIDEPGYASDSVMVGSEAGVNSKYRYATFVGQEAGRSTNGAHNTAVGQNAMRYMVGNNNTALGSNTLASLSGSGTNAASGDLNTAIGDGAGISLQGSRNSYVGSSAGGYGVGSDNVATGFGAGFSVKGNGNVAAGFYAGGYNVTGNNNVATGYMAGYNVMANDTVAIGTQATASQDSAIAIGNRARAGGLNSISIGTGNEVSGARSGAIGDPSFISADDSYAIGNNNTIAAGANQSFVLGNNVSVTNANNVVLGNNSADKAAVQVISATVPGTIATLNPDGTVSYSAGPAITYSNFAGTAAGVVSVGAIGAERQIVNVAPGAITATSTDAINGSQLYSVVSTVNALSGNVTTIVNNAQTHYYSVNDGGTQGGNYGNDGATGKNSIAAGKDTLASGEASSAMGVGATASGNSAVAIGNGATALGGDASMNGYATGALAIGTKATATGPQSIAIGTGSSAGNQKSIALGTSSNASGLSAVAIGEGSIAAGRNSVALGLDSNASGTQTLALGNESVASGNGSTAIGATSIATGTRAIASGAIAKASALQSIAFGAFSSSSIDNGIALGSYSTSDRAVVPVTGSIPAGSSLVPYNTVDHTLLGAVSVGNATSYRQIINVADGTQAQDAVTIRQLSGALQSFAVTPVKYFHANSSAADSLAIGTESVAVGPQTVVNGSNGIGIGNGAVVQQNALGGIAIGQAATSHLADSIALGTQSSAAAVQGVAIGAGAAVTQAGGVALGAGSVASTGSGVAGYVPPTATDSQRIAIGATTSTLAAVSVGDAANGQFRQVTGVAAGAADSDAVNVSQLKAVQGTVAVIDQSTVKYDTNVDGTTNYSSVTMGGNNSTGPVAIHNVAPGVAGTDAVNVNQLNTAVGGVHSRINGLDEKINSNAKMLSGGIAASAAMAVVTPVEPGRYHVSGAVAGYNGQAGIGFNLLKRSDNGQTTLHAGVGWGSGGGRAIVRVGFGFSFD